MSESQKPTTDGYREGFDRVFDKPAQVERCRCDAYLDAHGAIMCRLRMIRVEIGSKIPVCEVTGERVNVGRPILIGYRVTGKKKVG